MSDLHYGGQLANRRAVILLIIGLAVVALAVLAAKTLSHHSIATPNPVAPLVSVVDKAKATAGAASRAANDLNRQTGSTAPADPNAADLNPYGP